MKKLIFIINIVIVLGGIWPTLGQNVSIEKESSDYVQLLIKKAQTKIDTNWIGALEDYLKAEQIAIRHSQNGNLISIYRDLQNLHMEKTLNYGEGLHYTLEGLDISTKERDSLSIIYFNRRAGIIYDEIESHLEARKYYLAAKGVNDLYGDKQESIVIAMDLASSYYYEKQYKKQIETILDIIESLETSGKTDSLDSHDAILIINWINISFAYSMLDDYSRSEDYVYKALDKIERTGLDSYKLFAMSLLSQTYNRKKDWVNSVRFGDSALIYSKSNANLNILDGDFYFAFCESLSELGRKNEAISYMKSYSLKMDSLYNKNQKIKANNIEALNTIKKRLSKVEFERNTALLVTEKVKSRNLMVIILLCITVLGLLVFRYKFKKNKFAKELLEVKQKQSNKDLNQKNREITSKILQYTDSQTTLISISNEIRKIEETNFDDAPAKSTLRRLRLSIDHQSKNKSIWKELEKTFEDIHPIFYTKLNSIHPDLTRGERLLCAYLKINLNTKEIAKITGKTGKSVEVMRTRLRKKLGISNDSTINLYAYINNI